MRMIHNRPPGGEQQVRHRRHGSCNDFYFLKGLSHEMDLAFKIVYRYAVTGEKYVNGSVNSEGHFKNLNQARRFFRLLCIYPYVI